MLIVNILYSPPPDGDDASSTYTNRAVEYLTSIKEVSLGYVGPLQVNDDKGSLPWYIEENETTDEDTVITIFLISCSADGSVHRNVRKIMRKIPKDRAKPNNDNKQQCYYAIAALGHARCENSANQMADTIFATARRFDKLMSSSGLFVDTSLKWKRLETQVELRVPEVDFDPWLKSLITMYVDKEVRIRHRIE